MINESNGMGMRLDAGRNGAGIADVWNVTN